MIRAHCTSGGDDSFVNETIFESKTQTDHIIAYQYMNKYCDFIHSEDTDFIAIIGPQYVIMKNVSYIRDSKLNQYKSSCTLVRGGYFGKWFLFYFLPCCDVGKEEI